MNDEYAKAPWTAEQVKSLNDYQKSGVFHPFTCGGDRSDKAHANYARQHEEDKGQLIATTCGWVCPICGYQQDWAHKSMADDSWRETVKAHLQMMESFFKKDLTSEKKDV